jgi:hypothetical protein
VREYPVHELSTYQKKEQIAKMRQLQLVVEVEHYICFGISHAVSSLISHSKKEYKNQ